MRYINVHLHAHVHVPDCVPTDECEWLGCKSVCSAMCVCVGVGVCLSARVLVFVCACVYAMRTLIDDLLLYPVVSPFHCMCVNS